MPAASRQKQKLTTSQSVSTATTVKAILEGALGTILYIRYLLPTDQLEHYSIRRALSPSSSQDAEYTASQVATQVDCESLAPAGSNVTPQSRFLHTMRAKAGGGKEADMFIGYLNGMVDAVSKQYLRQMTFIVYLDENDPQNVVEAYTFDFTYDNEGAGLGMTTSVKKGKKVVGSHKSALKEERADVSQEIIYSSLKKLMRNLNASCQELLDLPTKRFLDFKLDYFDHTPIDYQPPGFVDAGDVHLRMGTTDVYHIPLRHDIGSTTTGAGSVAIRSTSIVHNLPPPRVEECSEIIHGQLADGRLISEKEKKEALKRVREEEEAEVAENAAKRRVMWTITEDDENGDGAKFTHIALDDQEDEALSEGWTVHLPKVEERSGDLSLKAMCAKNKRKRDRAPLAETLSMSLTHGQTATQHAQYINGAEADSQGAESLELESTQIVETNQSPGHPTSIETSGFLDRITEPTPPAKQTKTGKIKTAKDTEKAQTSDTDHTSTSSGQEVPSDSHTDPSSQEFCPKKDTFQATRRLGRTASQGSHAKRSASKRATRSKDTSKPPQKKATTPKNRKLKKTNGTGRFGTSAVVTPSTSIAAASKAKSKKKDKEQPDGTKDKGKARAREEPVGRKTKRKEVTPEPPTQYDDEGDMTCHCGDPEGEDRDDPISVGCEGCGQWFHGLCVGIVKKSRIPAGAYICVLCRAQKVLPLRTTKAQQARQDAARCLALTRKVLVKARLDNVFPAVHEVAEYYGVTMEDMENVYEDLGKLGFIGSYPASASATQGRAYLVDTPEKERAFARYFKPLGSLENDLFGLNIPADELPSSQITAMGSQTVPTPSQHQAGGSHSRSASLVGRDGREERLFIPGASQMDPIDEDSVLDQFTASQMAAPSRYGMSRYQQTGLDSIAQFETIDMYSSEWGQQGQGRGRAQESGLDAISSFETPAEQQSQDPEVSMTTRSKGSSRLKRALEGPLVLDDGEVPAWGSGATQD